MPLTKSKMMAVLPDTFPLKGKKRFCASRIWSDRSVHLPL